LDPDLRKKWHDDMARTINSFVRRALAEETKQFQREELDKATAKSKAKAKSNPKAAAKAEPKAKSEPKAAAKAAEDEETVTELEHAKLLRKKTVCRVVAGAGSTVYHVGDFKLSEFSTIKDVEYRRQALDAVAVAFLKKLNETIAEFKKHKGHSS